MAKTGILLLNIGTPRSHDVRDVKKYLRKFLMDKDIIDLPWLTRWPLVNLIIVPKRAAYSASNYKKIWMKEGSPLLVFTERFADRLQQQMGSDYLVRIGMRYSAPTIENALRDFYRAKVETVIVAPLYPQFAEATTGSSLREVSRLMGRFGIDLPTIILPPFFDKKEFIKAQSQRIKDLFASKPVEHIVFSFHGLPESQIKKVPGCLTKEDCCAQADSCGKPCYRAQSLATAEKLATEIGLKKGSWSVGFQSRLGQAEWLKPSTDQVLEELAHRGVRNVAVACPSFVADCIETLEEIGMGGKQLFLREGGSDFTMVPCVNDDLDWVEGFSRLLQELTPGKNALSKLSQNNPKSPTIV